MFIEWLPAHTCFRHQNVRAVVEEFFKPDYDALTRGLKEILGTDISGPEALVCKCQECKNERELIYKELEQLGFFQLDMAVQQSARK